MKILVQNYTFNAASGEITLTDYASVSLESLLLVTNVTDNIIIYNFADPSKGGTISGNVLNLTFDTSGMSNTDSLQIFIEDGSTVSPELIEYAKLIASNTKPLATQDANNRQRVIVESAPTTAVNATQAGTWNVNTTSTFGEITNIQSIARNTFSNGIRSKLIF